MKTISVSHFKAHAVPIIDDVATSNVYIWSGVLQFTLNGSILKVTGDLSAKKP